MPSLFALIPRDHRYTERLLDQLTADVSAVPYDNKARQHLVDYLVAAGSRHEAAEELVLWPAVRKHVPDGEKLVEEGLRQEQEAKYVLDALRFADSQSRMRLSRELTSLARAHIAFEEDAVLSQLKKAIIWPGGWVLGAKFTAAKGVAPTRPHPHGPSRRLGLLTKGLWVAGVDRLRDRLTGRRS